MTLKMATCARSSGKGELAILTRNRLSIDHIWQILPNAPFNVYLFIELCAFEHKTLFICQFTAETQAILLKHEGCNSTRPVSTSRQCVKCSWEIFFLNIFSFPSRSLAVGTKSGYKFFSLSSVDKLEQIYECSKYLISCWPNCIYNLKAHVVLILSKTFTLGRMKGDLILVNLNVSKVS